MGLDIRQLVGIALGPRRRGLKVPALKRAQRYLRDRVAHYRACIEAYDLAIDRTHVRRYAGYLGVVNREIRRRGTR